MKLTFKLTKNRAFIEHYLYDMQKFVSVHPIISRIEPIDNNTYLFYETLTFVGIPFLFKYKTEISKKNNSIEMKANVLKLVKINIDFSFVVHGDHTIVEEYVKFDTFLPIKFILKKIFIKQHALLFKNIEQENDTNF